MNLSGDFERVGHFLDEHYPCANGPTARTFTVWLPPEHPDATVKVECACGKSLTVSVTRQEARALVLAMRQNGLPVREFNEMPGGTH